MQLTIINNISGSYVIIIKEENGIRHYIDPFPSYNAAYEYARKFILNKDDLK